MPLRKLICRTKNAWNREQVLPTKPSSLSRSLTRQKNKPEEGEVAAFLRGILGPLMHNDEQALNDLLGLLELTGLATLQDVGKRVKDDTLMELHPTLPLSVLTLLLDFYSARIYTQSGQCYGTFKRGSSHFPLLSTLSLSCTSFTGEVHGTVTGTPPAMWFLWKRLLADIFFFYEWVFLTSARSCIHIRPTGICMKKAAVPRPSGLNSAWTERTGWLISILSTLA